MSIKPKEQELKNWITNQKRLAIAFSGGVDSSFLAQVTFSLLGDQALAILVKSQSLPEWEFQAAIATAKKIGIRLEVIEVDELANDAIASNPDDRCYHCKTLSYSEMVPLALSLNFKVVADGTNADDLSDYRPGLKAKDEQGVLSPLALFGITKAEIRILSKKAGLAVWDKPSFPCLNSRIPYGQEITDQKLKQISQGERFLLDLGLRQVRLRHHGKLARIEVEETDFNLLLEQKQLIVEKLKSLDFTYVTFDLQGFRSGSLNEVRL
ncbi:MAG: ATP-dependent sacrificial sulfur transferase LarE [SAR324 cluster bacterium]|nr:ATP-dependent sacrificial sulfur transferase LarE [SAR324 cluster bacterium]